MDELERRYRVLADVVVGAWALPEIGLHDHAARAAFHTWERDAFASAHDSLAAQVRLLDAFVRDDRALDAWFRREAVRHVLDTGLDTFCIDIPEEELLRPVISMLPPPDREFFEDAIETDDFCELADPFLEATSAKIVGVSVAERLKPTPRSDHALALKAYRVCVDVAVEVVEIDEAEAERRWLAIRERCGCDVEVTADRFARLQSSLMAALRSCEEELDLWLKQEVFREIVDYGDEPLIAEPSDKEILGRVIAGLEPADRMRFESLLEDGTLYEGARAFYRAVGASTREVSVAEVPVRFAGRW